MLNTYLPALARSFDEAIEAGPNGIRGWGQFLTHNHNQIGTYGTSAGLLVKTYDAPNANVPDEALSYLERELDDAGQGASKFTQTVRLAFLVLATAKAEGARPRALGEKGTRKLLDAQDLDGAWGDWTAPGAVPRLEATTWAVIALSGRDGAVDKAACIRGAQWLKRQVEASPDIGAGADAVTLGAIMAVLKRGEVDRRTIAEAVRILSAAPPDGTRISFFDFRASDADPRLRRDFFCVPAFFGYALLACSPGLATRGRGRLRVARARRQAAARIEAIVSAGKPFEPTGATYPSTVDQAFVALTCDLLDSRRSRLDDAYSRVEQGIGWMMASFVPPTVAAAALAVQTGLAQNPTMVAGYLVRYAGAGAKPLAASLVGQADNVRLAVVVLALFTGKPLVDTVLRYVRRRLGWPWW